MLLEPTVVYVGRFDSGGDGTCSRRECEMDRGETAFMNLFQRQGRVPKNLFERHASNLEIFEVWKARDEVFVDNARYIGCNNGM